MFVPNVFGQYFKGKVVDSRTGESMPYVKVSEGDNYTFTDIDGNYSLKAIQSELRFQYVGYKDTTISLNGNYKLVRLRSVTKDFVPVVIKYKEDPAYRVARALIKNKDLNDPLKKQFSYSSYNKFYFTMNLDSLKGVEEDDTSYINFKKSLEKHYLFLTESATDRFRKSAVDDKQIVRYERTSGLKAMSLSITASEFQSFSFYPKSISVGGLEFINPFSKLGLKKYDLVMKDTLIEGADSIFTMTYEPSDKSINGLRGQAKISSNGYAFVYVDASPLVSISNMNIHIKQIYKRIDNHWFPTQLNTSLHFVQEANLGMLGSGKTYIEKVNFEPNFEGIKFNHLAIEKAIDPEGANKYADSLTDKERATYRVVDSVGKKQKLDTKMKILSSLVSGKVPLGIVSFDLKHLLKFNDFEGFRLGGGLVTNDKLAPWFELGGYGAYGFKDKTFKYGGHLEFKLNKDYDSRLNFSYRNDIKFRGVDNYSLKSTSLFTDDSYLDFFRNKADYVESYSSSFKTRLWKHFSFKIEGGHNKHQITDDYTFEHVLNENVSLIKDNFSNTYVSFETNFTFNEKFIYLFDQLISQGSNSPVVNFKYERGLDLFDGEYMYSKYDLKINYVKQFQRFGKLGLQLNGGLLEGDVPISLAYNLPASYDRFTVSVVNSFETMRKNEFFASQYASFFMTYNVGRLYKTKISAPQLEFSYKGVFGELTNDKHHQNINYLVPTKGYYEVGLYLRNLLLQQLNGYGLGVVYRIGPYHLPKMMDNFAFKLTFNFSL